MVIVVGGVAMCRRFLVCSLIQLKLGSSSLKFFSRQYTMRVQNTANEWKQFVKSNYSRKHLKNYAAGERIIDKLGLADKYKDATIVEAYSGPGVWSAALNNKLNPKRHLIMEPYPQNYKFMKSLMTEDNQLRVLSEDPYRWRVFTDLAQSGEYTPIKHPRSEINPHLLFTANLTMSQGEQLATQYLNCITNQSWLQRYGRVRLLLWVRPSTAAKLLFGRGHTSRSRVSVQAEACTDTKLVTGVDDQTTYDHNDSLELLTKGDFFPERVDSPVLIQMDPKESMPQYLDAFEYVTKMLFIQRTKPLSEVISILGPGASEDLGPKLEGLMDITPRDMSLSQLMTIVEAFHLWPFKPEILHDFYEQESSARGFAL